MSAHAQRFGHTLPTARTILGGVLGRNRYHSLPGPCCLESEDGTELSPTRITDALGEAAVPHHVANLQIFEIDRIELLNQHQRSFVVKVRALAPDRLMPPRQ